MRRSSTFLSGPDNNIEPGGPDQGQPTHFLPRQSRFLLRIRVAEDFGNKELVWSLTTHGKTERAYATLKPDYFIDDTVIQNNNGGGIDSAAGAESMDNTRPVLTVEGEPSRMAKVGQAVTLSAFASDDGTPKPRPMPPPTSAAADQQAGTPSAAHGLRLSWFVYRGRSRERHVRSAAVRTHGKISETAGIRRGSPGWVTPPIPAEGKWVTQVTFSEPGTYVLRCLAHDGGARQIRGRHVRREPLSPRLVAWRGGESPRPQPGF